MSDVSRLAEEHLAIALDAPHGRSAVMIAQDGPLRQTVIALRAGVELGEHNSPSAGTVFVLEGAIAVVSAEGRATVSENQLEPLPRERHSIEAAEDAVFLLTAVTETA